MNLKTPHLRDLASTIEPPSEICRQKARTHLDSLTKPLGSLGRLEDLVAQVYAIRQGAVALPMNKGVYVFAADHGITAEGVSAYPSEVTYQMVLNFLHRGAAVNVLAALHHVDLFVIDIGVDADFGNIDGLLHQKVSRGTRNMLSEAAMTTDQVEQAISIGFKIALGAAAAGNAMIAIGEMGIGNTTSASAITCALTGATPDRATGRGTGLSTDAHIHKIAIVRAVLQKHFTNDADLSPLRILARVGGLEIAAMTGMILGAAQQRLIVVVDGFISTAAAALAVAIVPSVAGYLIAGHQSEEPGHRVLLNYLKISPVLSLGMRLGEGTGAVLAMPIIESAVALYTQMATFASAGVSGAS